jgi:hypothetical protein
MNPSGPPQGQSNRLPDEAQPAAARDALNKPALFHIDRDFSLTSGNIDVLLPINAAVYVKHNGPTGSPSGRFERDALKLELSQR